MPTQTIFIEGKTAEEVRLRAPNVALLPGSTGRTEIFSRGVPLGPLMILPFAGSVLASKLTPAGVVVTDRGGFGTLNIHAFVEWSVPTSPAQQASMGVAPTVAVVAIAAAFVLVMGVLGWTISKITMLIQAITGTPLDPTTPIGALVWVAIAVAAFVLLSPKKRRRAT